jgi:uncharacterized damage-inducible protein DinB
MPVNELDRFIEMWDFEARKTADLLRALPREQYDFRPDAEGKSLGELAWHLAEVDAVMSFGIEQGEFVPGKRPPGIERPRTIEALAPGFEQVHQDALGRVRKLTVDDLDRTISFYGGRLISVRDILWSATLFHAIHHRGQLAVLCRLAGGRPIGLYGPTREEFPAFKQKQPTAQN